VAGTTESRNLSVAIERDADAVYAFLSVPENFPKWASGLGSLHRANGQWIAETPDGPMRVRFSESNAFGVLDHWVLPPSGVEIYIPLRVVRNGSGCELVFTLFRQPDMDQAGFEADAQWVMRDLKAAKQLLETK
jgi:hypothetical protein